MPRLSKIGAAALAAFGWTSGSSVTADFLVVAGGGGGGSISAGQTSGGGGAGGFRTSAGTSGGGGSAEGKLSLNPLLSYTVTVGAGGAGGITTDNNGSQGGNSVFSTITSTGGGYGGKNNAQGGTGGSGGGSGYIYTSAGGAGTANQGYAGGAGKNSGGDECGGGGGGAGAVGANASSTGGNGGNGVASSITGSSVTYAGGGGGGAYQTRTAGTGGTGGGGNGANNSNPPSSGAANLGGGGGGVGGNGSSPPTAAGAGGAGVVIISYVGAQQFGGGVVTSSGGNTIHTFTTSGTLSPLNSLTASYLIVAGGGGGGSRFGGGGGAGGLLSGSGVTIDTNSTYLVTVGAGGAGSPANNGSAGTVSAASSGGNSLFSMVTTTAIGGGAGGAGDDNNAAGSTGGSGGGSAGRFACSGYAGTSGQGNAGGSSTGTLIAGSDTYRGSGGGGAGGAGSISTNSSPFGGQGGVGLTSSISGTSTYYAGGGGGATGAGPGGEGQQSPATGGLGGGGNGGNATPTAPTSGTANLGGGGGGGYYSGPSNPNNGAGGSGGSGVVIISYPGSTQQMAGGTVTVAGGNVIHTFTSSGYLTPIVLVNNSLRFRRSASAYLNRTFKTPTSQNTWTMSVWLKRGQLGDSVNAWSFAPSPAGGNYQVFFSAQDLISFYNNSGYVFQTSAVYRDPASWYHVVIAANSAASGTNKVRLYVNGFEVTAFSTDNRSSFSSSAINSAVAHSIGSYLNGSDNYYDGEMTEYNFIDGQQLTPNSFGTFNGLGVWQPIRYGGSYGTNGFYLPFTANTQSYAGYFGGSGYSLVTSATQIIPATGDFTVEAMINFADLSTYPVITSQGTGGGSGRTNFYVSNTGYIEFGTDSVSVRSATGIITTNQWYYVAATRSGANTNVYVNGILVATSSSTIGTTQNTTLKIGVDWGGDYISSGYISNVRVSNIVRTISPTTAPTTNFTNDANTVFLTLQGATIVDNSSNAYAITNNGPVTTGKTYPFAYNVFKDQSPQGNNWTPNNFSGASGSTLDYMTDVPTLTSTTVANYATLNPLQLSASGSPVTSNGNLRLSSSLSGYPQAGCTFGTAINGFKGYFEVTLTGGNDVQVGFNYASAAITNTDYTSTGCIYVNSTGNLFNSNSTTVQSSYISATSTGGVIMIAFDFTGSNKNIWWGYNGTWGNRGGVGVPSTGTNPGITVTEMTSAATRLYLTTGGSAATPDYNFGQRPFTYTPPTGFVALNTFNLPTPTIGATPATTANKYFDISLYTGTGATQTITNSGSMQPDFVWAKSRANAYNHQLFDSVRGNTQILQSNNTTAEATATTAFSLVSFNSNGYTLGASENSNLSGTSVGWQWRASNATGVTNTAGSITSTVSANTTAGFSVVTYTGNGTAGATVGHGCQVGGIATAPSMVIVKRRNGVASWIVNHTSAGTGFLLLENTVAYNSATTYWTTAPTSSLLPTLTSNSEVNASGGTYVAYCFAQVAGYSAFGSYTGNGSSDGPFIYTGFRPRFVMIKASGTTGAWSMTDTSRDPYNLTTNKLEANTALSEASNAGLYQFDILSNGFKIRQGTGYGINNSADYIYMAFAENPFKYANAR